MKFSEYISLRDAWKAAQKKIVYREDLGNGYALEASVRVIEYTDPNVSDKVLPAGYIIWHKSAGKWFDTQIAWCPEFIQERVRKIEEYLKQFARDEVDYPTCSGDIT